MQDFVCALQGWSLCFHQSCASPIIKSHWPSRSDSLGIPSPFVRAPGWEASRGAQNLHNSGKTSLVLLFSGLWVTHLAGMGLILLWLCSFYHLATASSLSLDMGYLFLMGCSVLLLMIVQQLVALLVLSQMSTCPSTLPSWTSSSSNNSNFYLYVYTHRNICICPIGIYLNTLLLLFSH